MVRSAIDKALADRDQNLDKFCTRLDKDIALLGKEVKSIKQEAEVGVVFSFQLLVRVFSSEFINIMFMITRCNYYLCSESNNP